jgi:hypothetical protein
MDNSNLLNVKNNQPAAISEISLSQALLAPLDAIFKAQIHAARSFLNMMLQIGYPHSPVGKDGFTTKEDDGKPYNQEFYYDTDIDGNKQTCKVSIPALALVPVAPLAVESATFKLEMLVEAVRNHNQIQSSENESIQNEQGGYNAEKRPWFLVSDPISVRGNLAPLNTDGGQKTSNGATIQIEIKVGKTPMPSGLDKLLTFLTHSSFTTKGGE